MICVFQPIVARSSEAYYSGIGNVSDNIEAYNEQAYESKVRVALTRPRSGVADSASNRQIISCGSIEAYHGPRTVALVLHGMSWCWGDLFHTLSLKPHRTPRK
jgi:hypothetical protein